MSVGTLLVLLASSALVLAPGDGYETVLHLPAETTNLSGEVSYDGDLPTPLQVEVRSCETTWTEKNGKYHCASGEEVVLHPTNLAARIDLPQFPTNDRELLLVVTNPRGSYAEEVNGTVRVEVNHHEGRSSWVDPWGLGWWMLGGLALLAGGVVGMFWRGRAW